MDAETKQHLKKMTQYLAKKIDEAEENILEAITDVTGDEEFDDEDELDLDNEETEDQEYEDEPEEDIEEEKEEEPKKVKGTENFEIKKVKINKKDHKEEESKEPIDEGEQDGF